VWEGNALTVTTTHLKQNQLQRNGPVRSDRATLVEHYIRHDNYLTVVQITTDPIYLTEPYIRTWNFVWTPNLSMPGYLCRPAGEIPNRPHDYVPHHLPGSNPFLAETAKRRGLPLEALEGGAETI
jgi:hypothetical protein